MTSKTFSSMAILAVGLAASATALAQRSPACKPVLDAMVKVEATDHIVEATREGKTAQVVAVGGAFYIQRNGKWMKSPASMADMQAQEKDNIANAKVYTCTPAAAVPGVSGTAYHVHSVSEDGDVSDGTVVLGSNGLPAMIDMSRTMDGSTTHSVQRYSYTGVRAPM